MKISRMAAFVAASALAGSVVASPAGAAPNSDRVSIGGGQTQLNAQMTGSIDDDLQPNNLNYFLNGFRAQCEADQYVDREPGPQAIADNPTGTPLAVAVAGTCEATGLPAGTDCDPITGPGRPDRFEVFFKARLVDLDNPSPVRIRDRYEIFFTCVDIDVNSPNPPPGTFHFDWGRLLAGNINIQL